MAARRKPSPSIIKVPQQTHQRLQQLSREQNRPMGAIVTELLDRYERDRFWQDVNDSVERLRRDPEAWQDYQDEIALLEGGSMDFADEEPYFTPEEEEKIRADAARAEGR